MRNIIIAAAIAAALAGSAADAGTQKRYYSRQTLAGLQTSYTYTATYGAFGACSGGSQTAPITSCTRSDGTSADESRCAPRTQACQEQTWTCGAPVSTYTNAEGTARGSAPAASASAAKTACESISSGLVQRYSTVCTWDGATATFWVNTGLKRAGSTLYANTCSLSQ